ncbi:MAG: paraquat-inducible protein A [Rhodospirillales bacterium]
MTAKNVDRNYSDLSTLIACHECDLLHRIKPVDEVHTAKCTRCGATLYQERKNSVDRTLALAFTGLVLFVISNVFPFMSFKLEGRSQDNTLISGVAEMYHADLWGLSIIVLMMSIIFPLAKLVGILYVLIPLKMNKRPWMLAKSFRMLDVLHPWGMTEVYMLGVFVAYVKLSDLATVTPGIALYSFGALLIVSAAATASLDPRIVWEKVESAE